MSELEEETGEQPSDEQEQMSVWETVEDLKRSNLTLKKALGRQGLEVKALHEAIEAIARAQQEGQEKLAEYFEDLEEEETPKLKGKKMSKRKRRELELELQGEDYEDEDEMSTTTKMFLSGLAGFAAGSAVTALYFKYGPGAVAGVASATPQLASMQGLTQELPSQVARLR